MVHSLDTLTLDNKTDSLDDTVPMSGVSYREPRAEKRCTVPGCGCSEWRDLTLKRYISDNQGRRDEGGGGELPWGKERALKETCPGSWGPLETGLLR